MFTLNPPQFESIPAALQKAEQYRMLNEPREAESISLDILQVDPDNQEALVMLILAYTDKFMSGINPAYSDTIKTVEQLHDGQNQAYYRGIIYERHTKAHLGQNIIDAASMAYDFFIKAMDEYEEVLGNDSGGVQDAILRWNTGKDHS